MSCYLGPFALQELNRHPLFALDALGNDHARDRFSLGHRDLLAVDLAFDLFIEDGAHEGLDALTLGATVRVSAMARLEPVRFQVLGSVLTSVL